VRSNGIYAISIEQGDELVAVRITDGQQIVFLATHEGQAIRFDEEDVRPMGRQAYGVWGIRMEKGDYLVGMATTPKPGAEGTNGGKAAVAPGNLPAEVASTSEVVGCRQERQADPLGHRKRLRQAHPSRRIPPARPRRVWSYQRENHRT